MNPAANQRIAPSRVVLILALLLGLWAVFQYRPRMKEPPPSMAPVQAESKLRSAGLADNPDWAGLPELFAVWADKVEWSDGKAFFAYWHPGSRTYAYFFEVARQGGGYRFREVSPQGLSAEGYYAEEGDDPANLARKDTETSTHPFVFLSRLKPVRSGPYIAVPTHPPESAKPLVPVDLQPAPLVVQPAKTNTP